MFQTVAKWRSFREPCNNNHVLAFLFFRFCFEATEELLVHISSAVGLTLRLAALRLLGGKPWWGTKGPPIFWVAKPTFLQKMNHCLRVSWKTREISTKKVKV